MIAGSLRLPARALLFALALTVFAGPARAQPQPSANAIAIANLQHVSSSVTPSDFHII